MITATNSSHTTPLVMNRQTFQKYESDFLGSYLPPSKDEVGGILLLTDDAWRRVWRPDAVRSALHDWRTWYQSEGPMADECLESVVRTERQVLGLPHVMLRRIKQLRPDLYPLQRIADCELLYPGSEASESEIRRSFAVSYTRIHYWLSDLPTPAEELVYVARQPEETLVVRWETFVKHWDAFYSDAFCTLNVVDDDPRWFLFMHMEHFAIWGCGHSYANERDALAGPWLRWPFDYQVELQRLVEKRSA